MQDLLRGTSSHFLRTLSNAVPNLSRITCMGHRAGITSVKDKYMNETRSDARYFSVDGWSQCTYSRCTIQQIYYPPVFHHVLNALLYSYADYIRPPPDNLPARIQNDWGRMKFLQMFVMQLIERILRLICQRNFPTFRNRKGTLSQMFLLNVH